MELTNLNPEVVPVTILTGFLGAGKTTFLNAFLKAAGRKRMIIIENEFGRTSVDGEPLGVDRRRRTRHC